MARPFRLFSQYDFFSVFIPGLATLIGFTMLLPRKGQIPVLLAIIPVLVLSFVLGQALHAFAAGLEFLLSYTPAVDSHRDSFVDYVENPSPEAERVVNAFKEECAILFWEDGLARPHGETSREEWKEIYPTVQSHIYNNEVGRSRTFQSIFAFSRSMAVLLVGLPLLYGIHFVFSTKHIYLLFSREPKYLEYFPSFYDFYEVTLPLCLLGALLFLYSAYSYEKFFVQYLVSDFVSLRRKE